MRLKTSTDDYGSATSQLSGPPLVPLHPDAHLLDPVVDRARLHPDQVVAAVRAREGLIDVTAAEFLGQVRAVAKGLMACGVAAGERVALMSRTRLEWLVTDYAILAIGAVTVPVYETSSAEQVAWYLADSGAVLAVIESADMRSVVEAAVGESGTVPEVFVIDTGGLDVIVDRGRAVDDRDLDARIDALSGDDLATIIYTSGTTGRPKGCVLTHGNLRTNAIQILGSLDGMLESDERSLVFLPLAHAFARMIALVGMEHGVTGVFVPDATQLAADLAAVEPTMIVGVPRVFEKFFTAAQQQAASGPRRWLFARAVDAAIRFSRQQARGGSPALLTRLEHWVYDRAVYSRLRAAFGGSLRLAFSGGGPLGERLTHFFDGVGVRIFEGYGLTETSPVLTANCETAWMPGTVGPPLAGTTVRLTPDGEILASGPQVFSGYWRDDQATGEVFTADGWLRTGDLGAIEGGFLRIVGRKKELIVTAGGKNVAPAPLEDGLRAHPLISQAVVVGNRRPYIGALITIDEDAFEAWRAGSRGPVGSIEAAVHNPDFQAEIQEAIDAANAHVSKAESIRKYAVLPHDFTLSSGELTPTMKVRRHLVEERYAATIAAMYGTPLGSACEDAGDRMGSA